MSTRRAKHKHISSSTYSDLEGAESDLPYHSDNFPAPPASRTDSELNLAVLRRHNPQILELHHVAPYAVIYAFSPQTSAWEKTGCEGSAFLVSLLPNATHSMRYAVMVVNRRGLENFELELQTPEEIEITEEYIILQGQGSDGTPCVFGLWIFTEPAPASTAHQREELSQKIVTAAQQVESGRRDAPASGQHDVEHSADMARKGSLTAMLEQQRQQDDAWSVRSHSPMHPQSIQERVPSFVRSASPHGGQVYSPSHDSHGVSNHAPHQHVDAYGGPSFAPSADTDFFLSTRPLGASPRRSPSPAVSAQGSVNGNGSGQKATLLDLFKKAGENYNRGALG